MSSALSSQPALRSRPPDSGSLHIAQPSARLRPRKVHWPMADARLILLFLFTMLAAGCTNVRPVAKIGLVAPFEGLYRRTGYEALAAMRSAIADTPAAIGMLPLALDDGHDPAQMQRALEKLNVSRDVHAIIGPLSPELAAVAVTALGEGAPAMLVPFAPPDFTLAGTATDGAGWAAPLVQTVAAQAASAGARGLVLAGWNPAWPALSAAAWSELAGLPVRLTDAPTDVTGTEAVMWLGAPDTGAAYLNALRRHQPEAPFWLGPAGGDPVFAERTVAHDRVYWVVWTDDGYNGWAAAHAPSSPSAYLVYRATQEAIRRIVGEAEAPLPPSTWRAQVYTFGADNQPLPYNPTP